MAAPSSPRSLARFIFTGIERPVDGRERDERWKSSQPLFKTGSASPPKSGQQQQQQMGGKVRTTAVAYENTRIDYPMPKTTPPVSSSQRYGDENASPGVQRERTIAASAFQTPRIPALAASVGGQAMATTPPRPARIAPPAMTPKTALITDAKAGFHARAKQAEGMGKPALASSRQGGAMAPSTPSRMAPTPFPTPARPAMQSGVASYEARELSKSVGPGSGRPSEEGAPRSRPASVAAPTAISPVVSPDPMQAGPQHEASIEAQFAQLLDRMQIDAAVRTKMLATELPIKEAMLRSAAAQADTASPTATTPSNGIRPFLRKNKSALSLKDREAPSSPQDAPEGFVFVHPLVPDGASLQRPKSRNASSSFRRPRSASQSSTKSQRDGSTGSQSTTAGPGRSATGWAMHLRTTSRADLLPSALISLRILLRNETPAWIEEWARCGGYRGLLDRLADVVELEWREEQHDDALLHEMLRCLKALLMTATGRTLLASNAPAPYRSLVELLYSEKRPGDLPARQIIVDLVTGLFDIFPASSAFTPPLDAREWGTPMLESATSSPLSTPVLGDAAPILPMLARATTAKPSARTLIRTLMIGPPDEKEEATVDFIRQSRRSRVFKRWMEEIVHLLLDYHWVFCHSANGYLRIQEVNESRLEAPQVPGGMSGGVEAVAMDYAHSHLRLLNALLRSCTSTRDTRILLEELFESGLDKIVLTLRKCSGTYYPHIHLELGRFIDLATNVGFSLPVTIMRHLNQAGTAVTSIQHVPRSALHKRSATEGSPTLPALKFS